MSRDSIRLLSNQPSEESSIDFLIGIKRFSSNSQIQNPWTAWSPSLGDRMLRSFLLQYYFSGYKVEVSFVAICLIIILSIMVGLYRTVYIGFYSDFKPLFSRNLNKPRSFYKGLIEFIQRIWLTFYGSCLYEKKLSTKKDQADEAKRRRRDDSFRPGLHEHFGSLGRKHSPTFNCWFQLVEPWSSIKK